MELTFSEPFALGGVTQLEYEAKELRLIQAYAANVGVTMASTGRRLRTDDLPVAEVTVEFLGWDENNYLRIVFTVVMKTGELDGDALLLAAEENQVAMVGVVESENTDEDIAAVFVGLVVTAEAAGAPELAFKVTTSGVGETENMDEAQSSSLNLKDAMQEACGDACAKVLCLDALFVETEDVILAEKNVSISVLTDKVLESCADQNQQTVSPLPSPPPLPPSPPCLPPPPAFAPLRTPGV